MEESWNGAVVASMRGMRSWFKAWCAWCVCDGALTVSYCGLLYTTRRWLGALVDHLGSWTDLTFQEWQNGKDWQE